MNEMFQNMNFFAPTEDIFGQLHKIAMGEIANQISGRTITILSKHRIDCYITPLSARNYPIRTCRPSKTLKALFETFPLSWE